jgi:hypothetical protein
MVVVRPGQVPGGVPSFLAQAPSTPIPQGTFLPPITGAVGGTLDTNTVLLVHADGTSGSTTFTDVSSYARTLTANNGAQVTTAAVQFGSGAASFTSGSNAGIDCGTSADFDFGAGPFTIEAWAYFTATPSGVQAVISKWNGSTGLCWYFGMVNNGLNLFYTLDGTNYHNTAFTYSPPTNTWLHFATDSDASGVIRIYVNGSPQGSITETGAFFTGTTHCVIGNESDYGEGFPGYLDEIRVSKGVARYAGAFTPPIAPFTVSAPLTQAAQTLSAAGTVGAAGAITGTLNVTQQAQTIAAAGGVTVTGALAVTQASQTIAASGAPRVGGTLAVTQASQSLVASGGPRVGGTLGVAQQAHTLLATGTVGAGAAITGSLVVTQAPQTLVAMASIASVASVQARAFVLA